MTRGRTARPGGIRPEARPEILGLTGARGLACAGVVVGHVLAFTAPNSAAAQAIAPLAAACVTFFFALSGFLLGRPFLAAIAGLEPAPDRRRYARQRILRIFPGYVVTFLLADLALRAVYVGNATIVQRPRSDAGTGTITDPLRLLAQLTLTHDFVPGQLQTGINPSWSITTELCFYAALPVLAAAGFAAARRGVGPLRAAARLPLLFIALGLLAKAVDAMGQARSGLDIGTAQFGATWLAVFSRSALVFADAFGWGMAAALLYCWQRRRPAGTRVVGAGAVLVAIVAGVAGWRIAPHHYVTAQAAFALAAGAVLVVATNRTASGRTPWLGRALDWTPVHFTGRISYSLYLWHYPVLVLVTRAGWIGPATAPGTAWSLVLVFTVAGALATLTNVLIERPALRWGETRATAGRRLPEQARAAAAPAHL